jgi:nucleoside-diphosphate-sugar epimerase
MRLLVLGGTWFLGRALVDQALADSWKVMAFNRGKTSAPPLPSVVEQVRGDRTVGADLDRLSERGPWDAVVDTSAYLPADALAAARILAPVVDRYVLVSTVNAYAGWPNEPLTESSPLLDGYADTTQADVGHLPVGAQYGVLKAGVERAVESVFGERAVILRPGVILGPGEYIGRLPWWLRRFELGGTVLGPGDPNREIQPIDVRDVAKFALLTVPQRLTGAYNLAAPIGAATFGELLAACAAVTGSTATVTWVPDDILDGHGVQQWTELPLWRTTFGAWRVDAGRARAAGLVCRPLRETVADTWSWLVSGAAPINHPRWSEHGIDPAKERAILAAWRTQRPIAGEP